MGEEKTNFILHDDYVDFLKELSDEEFGKLIRAISTYNRTGELPNLPISLSIAFNFIRKRVDDERTKWTETREARTEAARTAANARWDKYYASRIERNADYANAENRNAIYASDAVSVSVSVSDSVSVNNNPPIVPPKGGQRAGAGASNNNINNKDNANEEDTTLKEQKKDEVTKKQEAEKDNDRRFNDFWEAYPLKAGKKKAKIAWNKLKVTDKMLEEIMAGLNRYRASPQWQKEGGQYVPHPSTFLNQERWKDEVEVKTGYVAPSYEDEDDFMKFLEEG